MPSDKARGKHGHHVELYDEAALLEGEEGRCRSVLTGCHCEWHATHREDHAPVGQGCNKRRCECPRLSVDGNEPTHWQCALASVGARTLRNILRLGGRKGLGCAFRRLRRSAWRRACSAASHLLHERPQCWSAYNEQYHQ
eukprot:scaffold304691_cov30-Tisochrysis_lutea.AAC.3